ncbi:hypothetical protein J3A83DRAFT_4184784 [Scleroderma citrinum]
MSLGKPMVLSLLMNCFSSTLCSHRTTGAVHWVNPVESPFYPNSHIQFISFNCVHPDPAHTLEFQLPTIISAQPNLGLVAFGPLQHNEADRSAAMQVGMIQTRDEVFVTGSSHCMVPTCSNQPSSNPVNEPSSTSQTLDPCPTQPFKSVAPMERDIAADAKRVMLQKVIVGDIFPDQRSTKELAQHSLSKALVMERECQLWEADKTATNKIVLQLAQALVLLCKAFKNAACNLIGTAYMLTPTSSRSSTHTCNSYKLKVSWLLEGHNFLYMPDQPKIFGHQALLDLTIAALILTNPLIKGQP